MMKIGIYGGTFDPIHLGHLLLAESVCEQLQLDQILFVPAFQNPHKLSRDITPPKLRKQMLQFAIAGHPQFKLSEIELRRKQPSYTYETVNLLRQEHPGDDFWLLMGDDTLLDFPNWREPDQILSEVRLAAVNRGGQRSSIPASIPADRVDFVSMPAIDISASDIRARVAAGNSIRYRTPRSVELFIAAQSLYVDSDAD